MSDIRAVYPPGFDCYLHAAIENLLRTESQTGTERRHELDTRAKQQDVFLFSPIATREFTALPGYSAIFVMLLYTCVPMLADIRLI